MASATDVTLIKNKRKSDYLPFETNLASTSQVIFKWEQIKKNFTVWGRRFWAENVLLLEMLLLLQFDVVDKLSNSDPRSFYTTRPDTRPIPVADGWAGAEMRVFTLSNSITMTDGPTDRRTDGQTDKAFYRVAFPQLKKKQKNKEKKKKKTWQSENRSM